MKQGKKLLRKHKEYLASLGLNPKNFLLERQGDKYFRVINLETKQLETYYL